MNRLMIDTETCGLKLDAPILSIGVTVFNEKTIGFRKTWPLDLAQSFLIGVCDPQTIIWWMKQGEAARTEAWEGDNRWDIRKALEDLTEVYSGWECEEAWAKGAAFDIAKVERLYDLHGLKVPWHYRAVRDTRTLDAVLFAKTGLIVSGELDGIEGVPHTAGYDAEYQATQVLEVFNALRMG
jgi:hypothetical protein